MRAGMVATILTVPIRGESTRKAKWAYKVSGVEWSGRTILTLIPYASESLNSCKLRKSFSPQPLHAKTVRPSHSQSDL